MNVLEITVRSDYGGGPEHLYLLEKYIDKKEYNIFTACPDQRPYRERYKLYSKKIFFIPFRKFTFRSFLNLLQFCRTNKIELIHSHGKGAGVYARLSGLVLGLPVIHTPHGLIKYNYKSIVGFINILQEKLFSFFTLKIINVSKSEQDVAKEYKIYNVKRSVVIPNGIELPSFDRLADSNEVRKSLGLNEEDFVIGNVSRLCDQKRVDILINSFKYINVKNKKLVIIGDGERRKELEELIKINNLRNDILLLGFRDDVPHILNAIDLYVNTSTSEGLPISILEAMACKKPIVATRVPGNIELVIDGYNGFTCNSIDYMDVADKINKLYMEGELTELGYNSYKIIEESYTIENVVKKIEEIYMSIKTNKYN